jgi:hypothetical protein
MDAGVSNGVSYARAHRGAPPAQTPATTAMYTLGFRELDVGDADNYTLTFTP